MAGIIKGASATGLTLYAHLLNADGEIWNGTAFEAYDAANYANYSLTATEQGSTGIYTGTFPAAITDPGLFSVFFYRQSAASPASGDIVVSVAEFNWDGTAQVAETARDTTTPRIKAAAASGRTLYAHILNRTGQRFKVSDFEDYAAANYSSYVITLTEQGSTGIYTAALPSAITQAGTYEAIFYLQSGGSPATGDQIIGTARIVLTSTGAMTGLQFYEYLLRTFKRDDKETEVYEALTDTVRDLRRRVIFNEDESEMSTTDTITALGEYKLDIEDNWGLAVADVVLLDGVSSEPLEMVSKAQFDRLFPYPDADSSLRGRPSHACYFNEQILLGPAPDALTYEYKVNFTEEDAAAIVEETTAVPYARLYREPLKLGTLMRLYRDLGNDGEFTKYFSQYENAMAAIIAREERNRDGIVAVQFRGI